jgi:ABC-2 type transport system permease protein
MAVRETTTATIGEVSDGSRRTPLMFRLIGAEISRLLSRRFTLIAAIVVLLGLCAYQIAVNALITPPTGEELAAAQRTYEEERRFWEANRAEIEQSCREAGIPLEECNPPPQLADYLGTVAFDDVARGSLQLAVYLVALTMFMIAGSFIGAEYSTGAIANWLAFIPRRGQVFASKLITVVGFGALAGAAGAALVLGAAVALARIHDVPVTRLTAHVAMGGRGILAAVALAVLGFCIGLLARHTAAAIGVLLGYLFVWFVRAAILSEVSWAQEITRWTPEANLAAIVDKNFTYAIPRQILTPQGISVDYVEQTVSLTHGLVYWGVVVAVITVVAALTFRRRDVS